uniref:Fatty acyl-CoA reductase n=1 Tax=Lactuca sativa TaxID=4236 RepID=A0A9R1X5A6_LACSA|nr:hypothetical protein LSAT_V11C600314090 [Lactuca sativa]
MGPAKLHGWPNVYVFTKAMGEMLLIKRLRQDVSLVILRPTIIASTYKEPFPGWIEGVKTMDSFIAAYGKGRTSCFLAHPDKVLDIPNAYLPNLTRKLLHLSTTNFICPPLLVRQDLNFQPLKKRGIFSNTNIARPIAIWYIIYYDIL